MGDTGNAARAERAQEAVRNICTAGVFLIVAGGIVAGVAWPRDDLQAGNAFIARPETVHKGNQVLAYLGLGVAGIGEMLVLIALIAWGVRLGVMSAERYEAARDAADGQQRRGYTGAPSQPWTNPLAKRAEDEAAPE